MCRSLVERLRQNPDGILEQIARDYAVSTFRWYRPSAKHRDIVTGARFEDVMRALTEWGEVLFVVHTPTSCRSAPVRCRRGSFARGYFNLHGASPIGGHIRADLRHIAFVIRRFAGRPSCSLQFLNATGEAMLRCSCAATTNAI